MFDVVHQFTDPFLICSQVMQMFHSKEQRREPFNHSNKPTFPETRFLNCLSQLSRESIFQFLTALPMTNDIVFLDIGSA